MLTRFPAIALAAFILIAVQIASPASADLILSMVPSNNTFQIGGLYEFEVLLTSTNFTPTSIDYYTLQFDIQAPGISVVDIQPFGLSNPYALPSGNDFEAIGLPSSTTFGFRDMIIGLDSTVFPYDDIHDGLTKSLARVLFRALPGAAPGPVPISLAESHFQVHEFYIPSGVFEYPSVAANQDGTIGTLNLAAVPEPSSLTLVTLVLLGAAGLRSRHQMCVKNL